MILRFIIWGLLEKLALQQAVASIQELDNLLRNDFGRLKC